MTTWISPTDKSHVTDWLVSMLNNWSAPKSWNLPIPKMEELSTAIWSWLVDARSRSYHRRMDDLPNDGDTIAIEWPGGTWSTSVYCEKQGYKPGFTNKSAVSWVLLEPAPKRTLVEQASDLGRPPKIHRRDSENEVTLNKVEVAVINSYMDASEKLRTRVIENAHLASP